MYNLDEFSELLARPLARTADLVQCEYGAKTMKPTTLVLLRIGGDALQNLCGRVGMFESVDCFFYQYTRFNIIPYHIVPF